MEPLNFTITALGTIPGIAVVVKLVCVPIVKALVRRIGGRGTVAVATACGLVLSLAYWAGTHWPLSAAQWLTAAMNGVIGGWAACGLQDALSALLRGYKFEDGAPPPTSAPDAILR